MLSDQCCSFDANFIEENKVTHIINLQPDMIHNVFDPGQLNNREVQEII